jgi:hypothetical protein
MHPLDGVSAKLDRAEGVVNDIEQAIIDYAATSPYKIVGEFNPKTSELVLRGRSTEPVPVLFGVMAGDAAHNMRSALDHLAWQLALLTSVEPFDKTQFPIALTPEAFESSRRRMLRDIDPRHQSVMEGVQPYSRTDEGMALRDLRVLSNTDKHRVLNTVVTRQSRAKSMTVEALVTHDAREIRDVVLFAGGPAPIDGAELARMTLVGVMTEVPEVKIPGRIPIAISFDDARLTIPDGSIVSTLRAMLPRVRQVVGLFEPDLN